MGGEFDLVVESAGKCFLCWKSRRSPPPPESGSTPGWRSKEPIYYSLQYLSRYLGMDVGKVISTVGGKGDEEGGVGGVVVDRSSSKSRLKVELCPGCAILSGALSELFQQLEKVEMEMGECLALIHGRLKVPVGAERTKSSKGGRRRNLEMAKGLRMEALNKCSRKLKSISPRVKLPKMDLKVTPTPTPPKRTTNGAGIAVSLEETETLTPVVVKMEPPDIKPEPCFPQGLETELDDQEMDWKDDLIIPNPHDNLIATPKNSRSRPRSKLKVVGRNYLAAMECDICHLRVPNLYSHLVTAHSQPSERKVEESLRLDRTLEKYSFSVTFPPNLPKRFQTFPVSTLNPASGQHHCHICPMRFATRPGFVYHYKAVHLLIKYTCSKVNCGKVFHNRASYNKHHLLKHTDYHTKRLPHSFSCDSCSKTFSQSCHLQRHQRSAACGADLKVSGKQNACHCRLCGRQFKTPHLVQLHLKREHGHLWKFHCDVCKKRFKRKDVRDRHRKNHFTVKVKNRKKLAKLAKKEDATDLDWSINSKL